MKFLVSVMIFVFATMVASAQTHAINANVPARVVSVHLQEPMPTQCFYRNAIPNPVHLQKAENPRSVYAGAKVAAAQLQSPEKPTKNHRG